MATFTAGTSFTDGVTGDVTAAKLNALVANATPLSNFITDRTAETSIATDDLVLISDTSDSGALNKMTVANFTNVVSTGTGTAASPAIRPTGDTNTGVFFPAADTAAISTAGSERVRVDSSGNVGIGTVSPVRKLDVNGYSGNGAIAINAGSADAGTLYFANGGTGTSVYNGFIQYDHSANAMQFATNQGTERLRIDSLGNVGIGTTSPASQAKLTVNGAICPSGQSPFGGNPNPYFDRYDTNGTGSGRFVAESTNANFSFWTQSTERLRIDSSGNVGIGTTSPTNTLSIVGSSPTSLLKANSTGDAYSIFQNSGGVFYVGKNDSAGNAFATDGYANIIFGSGSRPIVFGTNLTERLRITSDGEVCIGHSNSTGLGSITWKTMIEGSNALSVKNTNTSGATTAAFNSSNYSGSVNIINFYRGDGTTVVGTISMTNGSSGSSVAYNTSSDYRLKTNLEPITNGIDRVKQLPVYRFNWIADESGNKVDGFVAHEVTPVVPEAINGEKDAVDADGNPIYQGIDQSKIVPLLTAALKEAIAKIETLESKVAALEAA